MRELEYFPDGTPISEWFYQIDTPSLSDLGKQYDISQYGAMDDGRVHTEQIQAVIDLAHANGGGVVVVPEGTYMSGALFFKPGVNLYIKKGGVLLGSDDISDYLVCETRMEGETCKYFSALINADGVNGFTICGEGTIDGNGLRSWKAFWQRHKWNPRRTNKEEQRARLIYVSNSEDVLFAGVKIMNSQVWTNHFYKCKRVKIIGCYVYSPRTPVAAPSTDAIDLDVCSDVLVKSCHLEVNDDAVALKGGKGPYADTQPDNGGNERILIEDCDCGFCHSCLTCGSESVYNRNILMRRLIVSSGLTLFRMKMRPDTPQRFEYITVEDVKGKIRNFIDINCWSQYFDLKGRPDKPLSYGEHITIRRCDCECETFFNAKRDDDIILSDFTLEDLRIKAKVNGYVDGIVNNACIKNVEIEEIPQE